MTCGCGNQQPVALRPGAGMQSELFEGRFKVQGGTIPVGPFSPQLPMCRAAYADFVELGTYAGALRRALARRPPDRHAIHNARLDFIQAVARMISKLARGHYAQASCGARDFAALKRHVARLKPGLSVADREKLDRMILAAGKATPTGKATSRTPARRSVSPPPVPAPARP